MGDTSMGPLCARALVAARLAVLTGVPLAAAGLGGHYLGGGGEVWLTTTLGPTAYQIIVHPSTVAARARKAVLGHGVAIASGLIALAVFGLWSASSVSQTGRETLAQIGAQVLAVGVTVAVLTILNAHHAPAGASALLVASGIARPGPPLFGLVLGLGVVLVASPLLSRLPPLRDLTSHEYES